LNCKYNTIALVWAEFILLKIAQACPTSDLRHSLSVVFVAHLAGEHENTSTLATNFAAAFFASWLVWTWCVRDVLAPPWARWTVAALLTSRTSSAMGAREVYETCTERAFPMRRVCKHRRYGSRTQWTIDAIQ
jgi:hypothetical protein